MRSYSEDEKLTTSATGDNNLSCSLDIPQIQNSLGESGLNQIDADVTDRNAHLRDATRW